MWPSEDTTYIFTKELQIMLFLDRIGKNGNSIPNTNTEKIRFQRTF